MAVHFRLLTFLLGTTVCATMSVPYNAINAEPFQGMNFPTFDSAFAKIDAKAPTPIGFNNIGPIPLPGKPNGRLPSFVNYAPNSDKFGYSDIYPDFFKDLEPSRRFNIPGFNVGSMKFPVNNQHNQQHNILPFDFGSDLQPSAFDKQVYEQPKLQNNYDNNVQYPPHNINNVPTTFDQGTGALQDVKNSGSNVPKGPYHQYKGNNKDPVLGPKPGSQPGGVAPTVFATQQPTHPDRSQPKTSTPRRLFPVVLPLVKQEHTGTGTYGEDPSPRQEHLAQPDKTSQNQGATGPHSKVFKGDTSDTEHNLPKSPEPPVLANIPGANLAFQVVDKPKEKTLGYNNPASFENSLSGAVKVIDTAPSFTSYHIPAGSYNVPGGAYSNPDGVYNTPGGPYNNPADSYITSGSYFNPDGSYNIPERRCQVEFFFDFDHNNPFTERYNRIWMGTYGHVFPTNDAVVFTGNGGHLYVPYFAGNDLRPGYYLSLRVFPKPSGSPGQAILSNGFASGTSTMSLALVGNNVELAFIQRETQQVVVMALPIQIGTFSLVSVEQDDVTVRLTVGVNSVHDTAKVPMVSREPLYIGLGASPLGVLDPFTGTIDSLVFHKCPTKLVF